ncbi:bifunctional 3'-5' exonuclease/DNA polymerase [Nostoc sp. UHCC 0251]|uniref:bifunctional 3'-5' exonuclease/DNA polymerase n=1 Tax=Nostoc sp. UHCC 0251 TaxID=3110240 RepID=UPI002B21FEF3|nr:bifunctional 3'-5' exonuclease/DNA polymerase [Nostoc sp. UHCC 0251]MEA5621482.1 bifunctional 3'-5' exonuclease/DNA polymerase [Nostoc sp. UHCC 0251]
MNTSLINTNISSIFTPKYTLVSNVSTLNSALQGLFQAEVLAIDCETTGLDPLTDSIRLIQIAAPNHPVVLIDLPAIPKSDRQLLKKLLCNSAVKIAHNAKFDWQFLTLAGLQPSGKFFDTQLAYKVLTAGLKTSSSLQNIVKKLLHLQLDKTQQISDWCKPLTKVQLHYAAVDAAILLDLYPILLKKLNQAKLLKIARLEFQCMPVVAQMELNGMLFDLSRWQILGAKLEAEKTDALSQLKQLRIASSQMSLLPELTDAVNPNSPQQVLAALQAIGIKINSTNQSKLVSLAAQYPIIQALLDYRRLSKIIGTFTEKLPQHIHPKTGRIHPNYYQLGAKSGRFSCRKPPLQNIPRDEAARSCFIAAPGYKIIKADYSQIELRIMARLSGDTKMCQVYRQGADLHRLTASLVTGKYINEVTDEDRRLAKAINFGLIFGMGAAKLQIYAQVKYGVAMTLEQAKAFSQRFFEAYPGIARWHENIKRKYIQGIKESRTLANRRRRWVNKPRLSELFNHPVQGLNADINKLAMVKLSTTLAKFRTKLICVRHDEIVLECPETEVDQVSHILHNCMVAAAQKFLSPIPVVIDIKISNSW